MHYCVLALCMLKAWLLVLHLASIILIGPFRPQVNLSLDYLYYEDELHPQHETNIVCSIGRPFQHYLPV